MSEKLNDAANVTQMVLGSPRGVAQAAQLPKPVFFAAQKADHSGLLFWTSTRGSAFSTVSTQHQLGACNVMVESRQGNDL